MKYFNNCTSTQEVKQLFKKLALENHPDRGGKTEIMQEINAEYAFAIAKIMSGGYFTQKETDEEITLSEMYQKAINEIAGLQGLIIELVGNWVWVTGETRAFKDTLKAAGYLWAPKKAAWYFRSEAFKTRSRARYNLDEIKSKYGCTRIKSNDKIFLHQ